MPQTETRFQCASGGGSQGPKFGDAPRGTGRLAPGEVGLVFWLREVENMGIVHVEAAVNPEGPNIQSGIFM